MLQFHKISSILLRFLSISLSLVKSDPVESTPVSYLEIGNRDLLEISNRDL